MEIPCKECIVLAICKQKNYVELVSGCSKIGNVLYTEEQPRNLSVRRPSFHKHLAELDKLFCKGWSSWFISCRKTEEKG